MTNTVKIIIGAVVAVLVVAVGYSLVNKEPVSTEPIKIGATFPLTGKLAFLGVDEKEGIDFALKQINENQNGINGRRLELVVEDNEGDPKKAVSAFNKIILQKPLAFISAFTHISSALAPLAEQNNLPMIYNSTINTLAESNPYVFKDYNNMEQDAGFIAKNLLNKGIKEIYAIVLVNDAYAVFMDSFENEYARGGGSIIGKDSFTMGVNDFRTLILKAKSSGAKNILLASGFPNHVIPFMQQMEELRMTNNVVVAIPLCAFPQTVEAVGGILNKTNAVCTWFSFDKDEKTNEQVMKFIEDFEKEYRKKPNYSHAYTYDQTMVLAEAMRKCERENNLAPGCIKNKLLGVKNYDGIAGKLSFDENGVSERPTYLIQFGGNGTRVIK